MIGPGRDELLDLAERAARAAGDLLRGRFGRPVGGVGTKTTGTDMVSDADRDSEALLAKLISDGRPGDAVFAEEGTLVPGSSGLRWVIDPLDGTTNFLYGIPQWCVSVACEDEGGPVVGVVHDPNRDETFTAIRGGGAALNGAPIRVSSLADVSTALVATGFSYRPGEREAWGRVVLGILPQVRDIRRPGSAAIDLAWCAAGRFDAYCEVPCAHWDRAAGVLIVAEAGGVVSEIGAVGPSGPGVLAGPPALHEALRGILRSSGATI